MREEPERPARPKEIPMKTSVVAVLVATVTALALAGGVVPHAPEQVLASPCCKSAGQ